MEGEINGRIHCAPGPPTPEPPSPLGPPTVLALIPLVSMMLLEQHDHAREEPHRQFFEFGRL